MELKSFYEKKLFMMRTKIFKDLNQKKRFFIIQLNKKNSLIKINNRAISLIISHPYSDFLTSFLLFGI